MKLCIILIFVLISVAGFAVSVQIEKFMPEIGIVDKEINITISIKNTGENYVNIYVKENIPGNCIPIYPLDYKQPEQVSRNCRYCISMESPFWMWNISLNPKESKNITYIIKPTVPGYITVGGTEIYSSSGDRFLEGASGMIWIECNKNRNCESDKGENTNNCEDCLTGSEDGICDGGFDGRCDPDCLPKFDPDCDKENYYAIIAVAAIIILVLSAVVYRMMTSGKSDKISIKKR